MALAFDENRLLVKIDGTCRVITTRTELERKLVAEIKQKQREITGAAITAQENERVLLGAELHDNINQILATVKLYMASVLMDDTKRIALIEESHDLISLAMEEIRKLSKSLAPPTLGIMTLKDAIAEMIRSIQ